MGKTLKIIRIVFLFGLLLNFGFFTSCIFVYNTDLQVTEKECAIIHSIESALTTNAPSSEEQLGDFVIRVLQSVPGVSMVFASSPCCVTYRLTTGLQGEIVLCSLRTGAEPEVIPSSTIFWGNATGRKEIREERKFDASQTAGCHPWPFRRALVAVALNYDLNTLLHYLSAHAVKEIIQSAGYDVVFVQGKEFNPEIFSTLPSYGIVVLYGHGSSFGFQTGVPWDETKFTPAYRYLKQQQLIFPITDYSFGLAPITYIGVRPGILPDGFLGTMLVLCGCETLREKDVGWAVMGLRRGCSGIIGFEDTITCNGFWAIEEFFRAFIKDRQPLESAVVRGKAKNPSLTFVPKDISSIIHNGLPTAVIVADPLEGEAPLRVKFDASKSSDPEGRLTRYVWSIDNAEKDGVIVEHVFTLPGVYTVTLYVVDECGHTDQAQVVISVREPANKTPTAVVQAVPTVGPAPLTVSFDASKSYDPDGRIVLYDWDFGDGEAVSAFEPYIQHTYVRQGTFTATLKVTDDRGASAVTQVVINVTPPSCPDLIPTEIWVEPSSFSAGQRVKVWAKVKNVGYSNSTAFRVSMAIDGKEFDSGFLNDLPENQIATIFSAALLWPDNTCHSIAVVVDPDNTVRECDEANNRLAQPFCPSLQCVNLPSIWTDKSVYCLGDEAKVYIRVSAPSYVDVWIVYENGQVKTLVQNHYLEDPGQTYLMLAKTGEPVGSRRLYVKARACGTEATTFCEYQVTNCQQTPSNLPNLVIADFQAWGNPSTCPSGKIKFSFIVKNKGNASSGKTSVFVYQEECRAISVGVWSAEVAGLQPGEWIPFSGEVVYCNDIGGLSVNLVVIVDPSNAVQESNETDNTAKARVENPCSGISLPDLVIADVQITYAAQCVDLADRPVIVCFFINVKNAGLAPSPETALSFDLLYCGLGEIMLVPSLHPGQSVSLPGTPICLSGDQTCINTNRFADLRFTIDPYNYVQEANENNNIKYIRVYIPEGYCL